MEQAYSVYIISFDSKIIKPCYMQNFSKMENTKVSAIPGLRQTDKKTKHLKKILCLKTESHLNKWLYYHF